MIGVKGRDEKRNRRVSGQNQLEVWSVLSSEIEKAEAVEV